MLPLFDPCPKDDPNNAPGTWSFPVGLTYSVGLGYRCGEKMFVPAETVKVISFLIGYHFSGA